MENLFTTFRFSHSLEESGPHSTYQFSNKECFICETWMYYKSDCFHCRLCHFGFHKKCQTILMESNLTIDRPETHEHTLTFIRKKNSFYCDACGRVFLGEILMNMYTCLTCNFFIHRECMYLPKVIKLTCHSHRLFHTYQVPDCKTKCRLCTATFVRGCGGYICIDTTCDYKLHARCATDKKIWDGRDVEGEPEETSNSDQDVTSSLEEIDGGKTFRHFSHHHDLMPQCVNGEEKGGGRVCEACILPIDYDNCLGCKECDFALHETCANLPRTLEHIFHRHKLTLEVDMMNIEERFFRCSKCKREACGFMYRCCQEECEFKMDAKCASLSNPFYNGAHKHHFFLVDWGAICKECAFNLKPKLATLPVLVNCKCDIHPLTLCFVKKDSWPLLPFRCEICEITIQYDDRLYYKEIYGCFDCNNIVHVECAIGKYPYLKPGHTIKINGFEIEIASNTLSRPICHACHSICQDKLVFKNKNSTAISFCSINCIIPP